MTGNSSSRSGARRARASSSGVMGALTGGSSLTASQLFDRKGTSRFATMTVFSLALLLGGAVAWSSVMPIAEISVSSGEVVPSGSVQRVQHFEGGIVSRLLVQEGDRVEKGQVLVELAPNIAETELGQMQTRLMAAELRIKYLGAARDGGIPGLEGIDSRYRDLALAESRALAAKRESLESQKKVLSQQVKERRVELATLAAQADAVDEQIALAEEQIAGRRTLVAKGLFSRMELIEDERDLARLTGERTALVIDAERIAERIRESESRIVELDSRYQSELATEISSLAGEAAELRIVIDRASDRVSRLKVIAPVSGRVQGLQVRTIGGVVESGSTLLDIVPGDARQHVEARVSTRDVGHIRAGQEATIKVLTYEYTRHGVLKGRVAQISPSTFTDDDGRPFYKARIELEDRYVGNDESMPIRPGMTVLADIVTGEKTLLSYLLSPIVRSLDSALHER